MKTKLTLLLLALCMACTNMNRPLTDQEKEKLIGEAKGLISTIVTACENPDPEKIKSSFVNSPDFVSLVGGVYADYDQSLKNVDAYLDNVKNQIPTITGEKYLVLDESTVLYTANSKWEIKLKNDTIVTIDPMGIQFILKKMDDQWKILSWTEAR